jgi:hypothetical protein
MLRIRDVRSTEQLLQCWCYVVNGLDMMLLARLKSVKYLRTKGASVCQLCDRKLVSFPAGTYKRSARRLQRMRLRGEEAPLSGAGSRLRAV